MKKNTILSILTICAIALSLFITAEKVEAQVANAGQSSYSAPQTKYSIANENLVKIIDITKSIDVPFMISDKDTNQYNTTVTFDWNAKMRTDDTNKIVSLNFTIICNENRLESFRKDFVGVSVDVNDRILYTISNDALRNGENKFTLKVTANTISVDS